MCVCVRERERERVCVCVCESECVCVCLRESECVSVRKCQCVCLSVCLSVCVCLSRVSFTRGRERSPLDLFLPLLSEVVVLHVLLFLRSHLPQFFICQFLNQSLLSRILALD